MKPTYCAVILAVPTIFSLVSCGGSSSSHSVNQQADLDANRSLWKSSNVENYSLEYYRGGASTAEKVNARTSYACDDCGSKNWVTITNGVNRVVFREADEGVTIVSRVEGDNDVLQYQNIDSLFDKIQELITDGYEFTATYDGLYGYPIELSYTIPADPAIIASEYSDSFSVTAFNAVGEGLPGATDSFIGEWSHCEIETDGTFTEYRLEFPEVPYFWVTKSEGFFDAQCTSRISVPVQETLQESFAYEMPLQLILSDSDHVAFSTPFLNDSQPELPCLDLIYVESDVLYIGGTAQGDECVSSSTSANTINFEKPFNRVQ